MARDAMAKHKEQIGISGSQTDALVCAAIRYLDSATDYRECLSPRPRFWLFARSEQRQKMKEYPQKRTRLPANKSECKKDQLILLDDAPERRVRVLRAFTLIVIILCIALLGLLRS